MGDFPIGDDANAVRCRAQGFPWCDTCKRPALYSEFRGVVHSTLEHPYGGSESGYDHEATMREWWATPSADLGPS